MNAVNQAFDRKHGQLAKKPVAQHTASLTDMVRGEQAAANVQFHRPLPGEVPTGEGSLLLSNGS